MYERGQRTGPFALIAHPSAAFLRNYLLRRGFMDGTVGLMISLMNSYSVFLKFAKLWELQNNSQFPTTNSQPPPTPKAQPDRPEFLNHPGFVGEQLM
jgi:hypothetical protein